MMKWVFVLLLLANVAFFAVMQWGSALTVDENNPPLQAALNADKIKIVSILPASAPVPASASVSASPPASAPAMAPAIVPASSVPVTAVTAVPAASSVPALPRLAPLPPPPAIAEVVPPAKLSCMEWGEFSGADLQRADNALATLKLGDRLKQRVVEYSSGYWIYIEPLKTPAMLKFKIALLKKLKVDDYFVVQEPGAWKNSISLGVFKSESSAKKYLAKLHERGIRSAKLGERASKLKFTVFVLNRLDRATESQVVALRKDFPDSEIKQVHCN